MGKLLFNLLHVSLISHASFFFDSPRKNYFSDTILQCIVCFQTVTLICFPIISLFKFLKGNRLAPKIGDSWETCHFLFPHLFPRFSGSLEPSRTRALREHHPESPRGERRNATETQRCQHPFPSPSVWRRYPNLHANYPMVAVHVSTFPSFHVLNTNYSSVIRFSLFSLQKWSLIRCLTPQTHCWILLVDFACKLRPANPGEVRYLIQITSVIRYSVALGPDRIPLGDDATDQWPTGYIVWINRLIWIFHISRSCLKQRLRRPKFSLWIGFKSELFCGTFLSDWRVHFFLYPWNSALVCFCRMGKTVVGCWLLSETPGSAGFRVTFEW